MRRKFFILLPGIRTDPSDWRNWSPKFADEICLRIRDAKASEFRYKALAVSPKGRQTERAGYVVELARRAWHYGFDPVLVAHSNGCEIVRQALRDMTLPVVDAVHLIAGATDNNFAPGSVWDDILSRGTVRHMTIYVGRRDWVLRYLAAAGAWLGYGRLGFTGPLEVPIRHSQRVTVIERDHDHCSWFDRKNIEETLQLVTAGEELAA